MEILVEFRVNEYFLLIGFINNKIQQVLQHVNVRFIMNKCN